MKVIKIGVLMLSVLILGACEGVSKRRHRKGFHIEWIGNKSFVSKKSNSKHENSKHENSKQVDFLVSNNQNNIENHKEVSFIKEENEITKDLEGGEDKIKCTVQTIESNDLVQKTIVNKEESTKFGLSLALLLGAGISFPFLRKRVRRKADWAKNNKKKARWAIGVFSVLLPALAFGSGYLSGENGFGTEKTLLFYGLGTISTLSYGLSKKRSFIASKIKIFTMLLATAGLFHVGGAQLKNQGEFKLNFASVYKKESKKLKDERSFKVNQEVSRDETGIVFGKFVLSLVMLGVAIYLGYLVALYACSLACAGYEVMAHIVLIGGWILLVLFLVLGLIALWKKKRKGKKESNKAATKIVLLVLLFGINFLVLGLLMFGG